MKNVFAKVVRKSATAFLVAALATGMTACGGAGEAAQQSSTQQEVVSEESASAQSTVNTVLEEINPEQINPEQIDPATHEPVGEESEKEAEVPEQTVEVIQKPEPSEEPVKEEETPKAEENTQEKEDKQEEESEKKEESSEKALAILDEGITFDGMELDFPIDAGNMKLGNWKLTFRDVDDPSDTTVVPGQVILADMTNPDYMESDVKVTAEFGNYTDGDLTLSDMDMTGIYIRKGEGDMVKVPEVTLPGGLTWGSKESEVSEALGEASFSSFPDGGFDSMYENGNYLMEVSGGNETGIDYIAFSME